MNQAPLQHNPQVQVSVPQTGVDLTRRLEKQMCGYVIAIMVIIVLVLYAGLSVFKIYINRTFILIDIANLVAVALALYFFGNIAFVPEYAAGNPGILKIWPLALAGIISNVANYLDQRTSLGIAILAQKPIATLFQGIGSLIFGLFLNYCMFLLNDDGGSCCLCFKPWVYKRIPFAYGVYGQPPQGYPQMYPPQAQGYPQMYPPQAQGYPQMYPPQAQGYPQGYPQVYPQGQGHPQDQGHPQGQGHPQSFPPQAQEVHKP